MDINKLANPGALRTKVYVPGKSKQEVARELGLKEIIKMASNESALGASPRAKEAYAALTDELNVYPDAVSRDLRKKLSEKLGCSADEITISNGADGVIYNLGMAIIKEGDEAIIPEVTFPLYETIVKVMRGTPIYTGMNGYRIDLKKIEEAITDNTKVIFLCNPNNPTGDAQEREAVRSFLSRVPEHILVVVDEAYIDFTSPETDPETIDLFNGGMKNLFILRSFSKIYGLAGVRIGYGIGHEDIITLIHQIKPPFNVSIVGEQVALAALDDRDYVTATLKEMGEEKQKFYNTFEDLGLDYVKSHTNFILFDTGRDAKSIFDEILKRGVIVRPCNGFGLPTSIRVTIGTPKENDTFLSILKEVLKP